MEMNLVMVEEEIQTTMESVVLPGFLAGYTVWKCRWCLWTLMRLFCKTERVPRFVWILPWSKLKWLVDTAPHCPLVVSCLNVLGNASTTVACEYRTENSFYSTFKFPIATISLGLDLSIRKEGKLLIRGMSGFQCSHLHKLSREVMLGI